MSLRRSERSSASSAVMVVVPPVAGIERDRGLNQPPVADVLTLIENCFVA